MDNYSLSDIKAATEGSNDGMFGGGSWAVVLIILFLIIMMGGGAWGTASETEASLRRARYSAALTSRPPPASWTSWRMAWPAPAMRPRIW